MASLITAEQSEENGLTKFIIKFIRYSEGAKDKSEVFAINKMAYVRFRAEGPNKLYMSMQKIPKTSCKIQIFDQNLSVSNYVCQALWSNWINLGQLNYVDRKDQIYMYKAEVYINIYKYTERIKEFKLFEPLGSSDFLLSTEDGSVVGVHREYLANSSDVFKTMLAGQWKETDKGLIEMKGVTLKTLEHFVEYLYYGSLPEHYDLRPLLLLASQYCIEDLKAESIGKLVNTIKDENIYSLLKFAGESRLPELSIFVKKRLPLDCLEHCFIKKKKENMMNHLKTAPNTE